MIRVLFVCLGNICRSPMAEAVFRDLLRQADLSDKIEVDSAGLGPWHSGKPPHEGTRDLLDGKSISYKGIRARQVHTNDWHHVDYMIAMDDQNISALEEQANESDGLKAVRLMDFADEATERNIPDPYFTGNFQYTYELVSKGCNGLLEHIRTENNI